MTTSNTNPQTIIYCRYSGFPLATIDNTFNQRLAISKHSVFELNSNGLQRLLRNCQPQPTTQQKALLTLALLRNALPSRIHIHQPIHLHHGANNQLLLNRHWWRVQRLHSLLANAPTATKARAIAQLPHFDTRAIVTTSNSPEKLHYPQGASDYCNELVQLPSALFDWLETCYSICSIELGASAPLAADEVGAIQRLLDAQMIAERKKNIAPHQHELWRYLLAELSCAYELTPEQLQTYSAQLSTPSCTATLASLQALVATLAKAQDYESVFDIAQVQFHYAIAQLQAKIEQVQQQQSKVLHDLDAALAASGSTPQGMQLNARNDAMSFTLAAPSTTSQQPAPLGAIGKRASAIDNLNLSALFVSGATSSFTSQDASATIAQATERLAQLNAKRKASTQARNEAITAQLIARLAQAQGLTSNN